MAVRPARPAIRRRKPDGGSHQYRHRSRRACACGWLYAVPCYGVECDQRHALRQAQLQLHSRHRAGRGHHPLSPCHAGNRFRRKPCPSFISYVKSNPGKVSYGSGGIGTSIHVASELFKMMAGIDMIHVPYRGGAPAMTDLMGGQVQVVFNPVPESMEFIKAGKLRPLAVTTATRSEVLPDVPTVAETLPGYEASAVQGIGAPKDTPAEIVDKLNKEINAGLADPRLKARVADLGATVFVVSPADFRMFIADETEKWAKVIKFAGAKAE